MLMLCIVSLRSISDMLYKDWISALNDCSLSESLVSHSEMFVTWSSSYQIWAAERREKKQLKRSEWKSKAAEKMSAEF